MDLPGALNAANDFFEKANLTNEYNTGQEETLYERFTKGAAERASHELDFKNRFGINASPRSIRGLMDAYDNGSIDDDGVYSILTAQAISDNLAKHGIDIPMNDVLVNMDAYKGLIIGQQSGKDYAPKDTLKAVIDSFGVASLNTERSLLGLERMEAEKSGDEKKLALINEQMKIIDRQIAAHSDPQKRNPVVRAVEWAAQSSIYTASIALTTMFNPVVGFMTGTAMMSGGVYNDLRDSGVEAKNASLIALGVGALESIIETQLGVVGGLVSRAGGKTLQGAISKKITQTLISKLGAKGVWVQAAMGVGTRYVTDALGEGLEEVLQEMSEIGGLELANIIQKEGIDLTDEKRQGYVKQIWDAGVAGFASALVMGFVGVGADAFHTTKDMIRVKNMADAIPNLESFKKESKPHFNKKMSDEEIEAQQKIIYEGRKNLRENEEAKLAAELSEVSGVGKGYDKPKTKPGTAEETYLGETYHKKDGRFFTELDKGIFKGGDPRIDKGRNNLYFHFEFSQDEDGTVHIKEFIVRSDLDTPEFRHEAYDHFAEAFSGVPNILWDKKGMSNREVEIRNELEKNNPYGTGLNYYPEKINIADEIEDTVAKGDTEEAARAKLRFGEQMAQHLPGSTEASRSGAVRLIDRIGRSYGLTFDKFLEKLNLDPNNIFTHEAGKAVEAENKMAAQFAKDGERASRVKGALQPWIRLESDIKSVEHSIVYLDLESADFSTVIHELKHAVDNFLEKNDMELFKRMMDAAGEYDPNSGTDEYTWRKERSAYAFENYLATGEAPTPELRSLFQQLKEWLRDIIKYLSGMRRLTAEQIEVFDELLSKADKVTAEHDAATAKQSQTNTKLDNVGQQQETSENTGKTLENNDGITEKTGETLENTSGTLEKSGETKEKNDKTKVQNDKKKQEKNNVDDSGVSSIREQYEAAEKVYGDTDTININGEEIEGRWVITEAETPTASHNETTFNETEGFLKVDGKTINDRDYKHDRAAQEAVLAMANNYDSRALEGVVVSSDGIVISGNNRTMSGKLAAKNDTDGKYLNALRQKAKRYGFTEEQVNKFEHPRLLFEVDVKGEYDTALFAQFNRSTTKAIDPVETAVKMAKLIKQPTVKSIAAVIKQHESIDELYKDRKALQEIFNTLKTDKLIGEYEMPQYYTEQGGITGAGEDLLENVLLGATLEEDSIRVLSDSKDLRRKLARALPYLIENKAMGDYSVIPSVNEAVRIAADVEKNSKIFKNVEEWAAQSDFDFMEQKNQIAIELAKQLEGKTQSGFADMMGGLNAVLSDAASGQADLLASGIESKDSIVRRYLGIKAEINQIREANNKIIDDEKLPMVERVAAAMDNAGLAKIEADNSTLFQLAYQGSPFIFDEFNNSYVGSGLTKYGLAEHRHGWGHYLYGQKEAAEWFSKAFSRTISKHIEGQLYEVDIPGDHDLLQWEKPISEQADIVQQAADRLITWNKNGDFNFNKAYNLRKFKDGNYGFYRAINGKTKWTTKEEAQTAAKAEIKKTLTGKEFYNTLSEKIGSRKTSLLLDHLGVKGTKYFDKSTEKIGVSKGYNYVIFGDSDINITQTFFQTVDEPDTDNFKQWFGDSKIVDENGKAQVLYHQTQNDFDVFEPRRGGAGQFDNETPFGIFLKPNDNDIGLPGKKQMSLYARIVNPLQINDRASLRQYLEKNIEGYAELRSQYDKTDQIYNARLETLENEFDKRFEEWEAEHPESGVDTHEGLDKRQEAIDKIENEIGLDKIFPEWGEAGNKLSAQMKELVDQHFRNSEFDGIILEKDEGAMGKKTTKTFIAFDPNQVKSTSNTGAYDRNNDNILFQHDDEQTFFVLEDQLVEEAAQYNSWEEFRNAYEPELQIYKRRLEDSVMPRQAKNFTEAEKAGKEFTGKELTNRQTGMAATVSNKTLGKMLSVSASEKSISQQVHAFAVANVDALYERAELLDSHDDNKGDTNIKQIHRFGVIMQHEDEFYPIKITVKEYSQESQGKRIYTVEAVDIEKEKSAGQLTNGLETDRNVPIADFSNNIIQMLDSVKNPPPIPSDADNAWYRSLWEDAKKIHDNTLFQDDEDTSRGGELDKRFYTAADKKYLTEVLKELYRIHDDQNIEPMKKEGEAAQEEYRRVKRLQTRIDTELPNVGSIIGMAAQVRSGRELSSTQYNRLKTFIRNNKRDYRSVFADIMGQEEYLEELAEKKDGEPAGRLANPHPERRDNKARLKEIADIIKKTDPELARGIEDGTIASEDPRIRAFEKGVDAEYQEAKKAIETLEKETAEDYARLANDAQRRIVNAHEKMIKAQEQMEVTNDTVLRRMDKEGEIAKPYLNRQRLEKASFEQAQKAYSDLVNLYGISEEVREIIDRQKIIANERSRYRDIMLRQRAAKALRETKKKLVRRITKKVSFDTTSYEQAELIKTLQRIFFNISDGINKWIGPEDRKVLREVWSQWSTDEEFRDKLIDPIKKRNTKSGFKQAEQIEHILNKKWEDISVNEKKTLHRILPKTNAMQELELRKLAKENWESAQLDIDEHVEDNGEAFLIIGEDLKRRVIDAAGAELYNRMQNKPFAEWSLSEAEELGRVIDKLNVEGKKKEAARKEAKRVLNERYRSEVLDALENTGIAINPDDTPEEKERKRNEQEKILRKFAKGKKNNLWNNFFDANLRRFTTALDGGRKGIFTNLLYWGENDAYNTEQRQIAARQIVIDKVMKDNNINLDELYKEVEIPGLQNSLGNNDIDLFRVSNGKVTVDDLLYIMRGYNNEETKKAIMYGNLSNARERSLANKSLEAQENFANVARGRLAAVMNFTREFFAKEENKKFLKLYEAIGIDYDNNGERLNRACIDMFNKPMWRVENYVPMNRREQTGAENENRVIEDLLGTTGVGNKKVKKGFTEKRIDIRPGGQRPIELGLYKTWAQSVNATEHLLAYGPLVQRLNGVFKGFNAAEVKQALHDRWGQAAVQRVDNTIAEFANPKAARETANRQDLNRLVRALRGKTATAYLAWKASGVLKQLTTSPWPYLQEIPPAQYLAACVEVAGGAGKINDFIREKSVYMQNRDFDLMAKLIREARESNDNAVMSKIDKFNSVGMKGLEWIDWVCVAPGWLAKYRSELANVAKEQEAVYQAALQKYSGREYSDVLPTQESKVNRALSEVMSDEQQDYEAVARADDAVRRMQPSSRGTDIAPLYKNQNEVLNILLQFQTALNVIYQNLRYDLPLAIKEKQTWTVVGMVTGYMLAGVCMGLLTDGLGDDDDDEEKKARKILFYSFTQFTDAVPVIGDGITKLAEIGLTGKSKYSGQQSVLPAVEKALGGLYNASSVFWEDDPEKRRQRYIKIVENMSEAAALYFGLPTSGTKELGRAIGVGDGDGEFNLYLQALMGRKNKQ